MATVYKRGRDKGKRGSKYTIEYTDEHGVQRFKKVFSDKALSEQLAAKLENEVRLKKHGLSTESHTPEADKPENSPIQDHIREFEKSIARRDNSPKHVTQTVNRIKRVFETAEIARPADIDFITVETVLREMVESKEIGHKTHNHYLQAIDQFCKWLCSGQRQVLPKNPVAGMQRLNTEVDVRHPRRALTQSEFWQLVDSARNSVVEIQCYDGMDRARIYLISYFTGLRRKEIASLTRRSFDLASRPNTITVEAVSSKHRKKDVLPLHVELVSRIQDWLESKQPEEVLFPKLAKRRTWLMVKKDLERVGIPYETSEGIADFHAAGRHTHITELLRNGASLPEAKELARHSDVRTTMRYTHIGIEDQAKALNALPGRHVPDQCSRQCADDRSRPEESYTDQNSLTTEETEPEKNRECPAATAEDGDVPDGEHRFDPRRLHFVSRYSVTTCENPKNGDQQFGQHENCCNCRSLADSDRGWPPDLEKVADAWPHLPPHIREAIATLVDGSLPNQIEMGGHG